MRSYLNCKPTSFRFYLNESWFSLFLTLIENQLALCYVLIANQFAPALTLIAYMLLWGIVSGLWARRRGIRNERSVYARRTPPRRAGKIRALQDRRNSLPPKCLWVRNTPWRTPQTSIPRWRRLRRRTLFWKCRSGKGTARRLRLRLRLLSLLIHWFVKINSYLFLTKWENRDIIYL